MEFLSSTLFCNCVKFQWCYFYIVCDDEVLLKGKTISSFIKCTDIYTSLFFVIVFINVVEDKVVQCTLVVTPHVSQHTPCTGLGI